MGIMSKRKEDANGKEIADIAIIGCGPAGLSAAVNASIRRKTVDLFGGVMCPKTAKIFSRQQHLVAQHIRRDIKEYLNMPEKLNISIHGT